MYRAITAYSWSCTASASTFSLVIARGWLPGCGALGFVSALGTRAWSTALFTWKTSLNRFRYSSRRTGSGIPEIRRGFRAAPRFFPRPCQPGAGCASRQPRPGPGHLFEQFVPAELAHEIIRVKAVGQERHARLKSGLQQGFHCLARRVPARAVAVEQHPNLVVEPLEQQRLFERKGRAQRRHDVVDAPVRQRQQVEVAFDQNRDFGAQVVLGLEQTEQVVALTEDVGLGRVQVLWSVSSSTRPENPMTRPESDIIGQTTRL